MKEPVVPEKCSRKEVESYICNIEVFANQLMDSALTLQDNSLDTLTEFNETYCITKYHMDTAYVMLDDLQDKTEERLAEEQKAGNVNNENNIRNDLKKIDSLWDKLEKLSLDLNSTYNAISSDITNTLLRMELERKQREQKSKGMDLAVFSIIISIITFLVTNSKLLGGEIQLKTVLLVNMSFLLAVFVLFILIYYFLYMIDGAKEPKFKKALLIIVPVTLVIGIILIAVLMK